MACIAPFGKYQPSLTGRCAIQVHKLHDVHENYRYVNFVKIVNVVPSFSPSKNTRI